MPRRSLPFLLAAMLCLPGGVLALSTDREQPIHIEADSLDIDDARGVSVYEGNVRYTQGTLLLTAGKVTVYTRERGKLQRVTAEGAPATYRQRPDGEEEDVTASAGRIEYSATEEILVLQEDAHLRQGQNEFSGHRIEYNTTAGTVKAGAGGDGGQRVRVILQPPPKQEPAPAATPP